jgi:hypothetical protein
MPKKPKLNLRTYEGLKRGLLSLVLYSTFLAVAYEAGTDLLLSGIPLLLAFLFLMMFGLLNRRSFSNMGQEYSLAVNLFYVLVVGDILNTLFSVTARLGFQVVISSILALIGLLLVLSYIFEYSFKILRISNQFNLKGLKIASVILLVSTILYIILGVIPFSLAVTAAGMFSYAELSKLINYFKADTRNQ